MIEEIVGAGEAGEVDAWGNPWHGVVRDGVLHLPNGGTRPWPQPYGGRTVVFHRGDQPAVPQTAQDVADGAEFRDYALLSGGGALSGGGQLYGVATGYEWLVVDDLGQTWGVAAAAVVDSLASGSITLTFTALAFGEDVPAEQTVVVPVSDWGGQDAGASAVYYGIGVDFADASRTGHSALFRVTNGHPYSGAIATQLVFPCGWLRLDLAVAAGVFSGSAAVEIDRETALGVLTESQSNGASCAEPSFTGLNTRGYTLSGRVLAAWFDAAGVIQHTTLDLTREQYDQYDSSLSYLPPGPPTTFATVGSKTTIASFGCSATITAGGVSHAYSWSRQVTLNESFSACQDDGGNDGVSRSASIDQSFAWTGGSAYANTTIPPGECADISGGCSSGDVADDIEAVPGSTDWQRVAGLLTQTYARDANMAWYVVAYSPTVWGVYCTGIAAHPDWTPEHYSGAVGRGVVDAATVASFPAGQRAASDQPVTGQIATSSVPGEAVVFV